MEEKEKQKRSTPLHSVPEGLLSALVLTALSLLIIAVIYLSRDLKEETARNLITGCALLSVFISSVFSGRKLKSHGLISGALLGFCYSLCLYFTGFLAFGFPGFSKGLFATLSLCILSGAVGGIVGVNLKGRK